MINQVAIQTALWRWLGKFKPGASTEGDLDASTRAYLTQENPRLLDLRRRYQAASRPEHSCWASWETKVNLLRFRGEDDYVSQAYLRRTQERYEFSTAYVEATDTHGRLRSFTEDNRFGVKLWPVLEGVNVSRDLLDSIIELGFLEESLGFRTDQAVRALDIGAGYGRFAHRFTQGFPNGRIHCTDAIATSSFVCEFYTKYRGCDRATAVPFDELGSLKAGQFDWAQNIHSWSECTVGWVRFWLDRLVDLNVPYLFIVPHFAGFTTRENDGSVGDYGPELERHGYKLLVKRRKFGRSQIADRHGIYPADYYIFKRG